jgi:hypothetical protein
LRLWRLGSRLFPLLLWCLRMRLFPLLLWRLRMLLLLWRALLLPIFFVLRPYRHRRSKEQHHAGDARDLCESHNIN